MTPLITQERSIGVIADGGFYNWDLIKWLISEQVFFVIRGRVNTGVKPLVQKHKEKLSKKGANLIVDYWLNKSQARKRIPIKLVLYRTGHRVLALIVSPTCNFSGRQVHELYRQRFTIETYYRQMHRFQIFSCSRHPALRFIIVLIAFWLCNFWAYFKSPLDFLKPTSRRCRVDFVYTANDFCEFLHISWYRAIFKGNAVFSRR